MNSSVPIAEPRYWAVIPAAGVGTRMGAALPKQYLPLRGMTVLEHALSRLARHPRICGVTVVIAAGDERFQRLTLPREKKILTAVGGEERCHSVLNGLQALASQANALSPWGIKDSDWVLVHDAARPCVRGEDIDHLIDQLHDHAVGGLLGIPVSDTMKRTVADGTIIETVRREGLWRALTPQMFRLGMLTAALQAAINQGRLVTDEAQAMEAAGHAPRMVEGQGDNIKITRPQDLPLAELYLQQQEGA